MNSATCFTRRESLADYLANQAYVSSSQLRRFVRNGDRLPGAAGYAVYENAFMGEALHVLMLEPELFEAQYLVLDGSEPAGKRVSEVEAMQRTWLDAWQWTALCKARDAVLACTQAPVAEWLAQGEKELSIYWTDAHGDRWKARPDCFTGDIVLDLKTTADSRPEPFARTRARLRYDFQAAHYVEAVAALTGGRPRFAYVAAELGSPWAVRVHELSASELEDATETLRSVKRRYLAAVAGAA
ncbi:MAG: PD-(D/E)XK nuclease-like domain-containing protein [Burkholderiales bacterium]